jgi:cytochrome c
MNATFAKPYPHYVAMPGRNVNAAEMVNFCMIVPMGDDPLPWSSQELAALASYVEEIRPGYRPASASVANPCNPCGMKANPCNPCGGR